jgi:hypothetical protein
VSRGALLTFLLVLTASGLLTWWFLENFERREQEFYVGYSGEARSNPLLAARRFLRAMGVEAQTLHGLPSVGELPARGQTLLLTTRGSALSEARIEQLLGWVRAGGHLIFPAMSGQDVYWEDRLAEEIAAVERRAADIGSPLLAPLELELRYAGALPEDTPWLVIEQDPIEQFLEADLLLAWTLAGAHAEDWQIASEFGTHILRRRLGAGSVTVATELTWVENERIGELDHAELLWWLIRDGRGTTPIVWLMHDEEMPPLWQVLWTQARPLVIGLALLIVFALWAAAPRFGPLQGAPAPLRRRLLEHIEASGEFLWRHGQRERLLTATRRALERRLLARHPDWERLDAGAREARLVHLAQLEPEAARRLLHDPASANGREFTETVRHIESLRKQL